MPSYITSIGTATPPFRFPQSVIAEFMASAANMDEEERKKIEILYRASGINYRHSVIPDFGTAKGNFEFFPNTEDLEPFPAIGQRMALYKKHAFKTAFKAVIEALVNHSCLNKKSITHIITVSCTGMYAPGLDLELIESLKLDNSIKRFCINFMGCYAAFNALKLADTICKAEPDATVLIVCVELCTIHYQKKKDADHLLSNAIFGDGAAAAIVQSYPAGQNALEIKNFHCEIINKGKQDMAWEISDNGFEMILSSYVPQLLKEGIGAIVSDLLKKLAVSMSDIKYYAIHPGGKKILEVIEQELGLEKYDNRYAYHVLRNFGNMSSASILFVLYFLLKDISPEDHQKNILGMAFGPGLTVESMLLNVHVDDTDDLHSHKTQQTQYVQTQI